MRHNKWTMRLKIIYKSFLFTFPVSCSPGFLLLVLCLAGAQQGATAFSWDRVPLYAHVAIGEGFKQEQYEFLADQYQLITFTGGPKQKAVEPIIADAIRVIKQRRPERRVLAYWCSETPRAHYRELNASFPKDGFIRPAPDDKKRKDCFDLKRPEVRSWWADSAARLVREYGCDGIFVDGATIAMPGSAWSRLFGAKKAAEMEIQMFAMLKEAREKMGSGSTAVFNPLHGYHDGEEPKRQDYLAIMDGAMIDDFNRPNGRKPQRTDYLFNTLKVMSQAARQGKVVIFKAWPSFTWRIDSETMRKSSEGQHAVAKEDLLFPLACFLIAAQENCYFCYTWGWAPQYGTFMRYPEFEKPLGPPKGNAQRDGWAFRREFEHASVFVNLETRKAEIRWK